MLAASLQSPPMATSFMWAGAIVAGLRRKHAIGGWLLFFIWQSVAGLAITISYMDWSLMTPRGWHGQGKYFVYVLVTMPRVAVLLAVAGVGVALIWTYEWQWVVTLRYLLILFSILGAVNIIADILFFPSRLRLEAGTLIFPFLFTAYLFTSSRVRSVFLDRTWKQSA